MKYPHFIVGVLFKFVLEAKSSPSPDDWSILAQSLGKKFINDVRPPAAPCHQASFNAEECATAVTQWTYSPWRSSQVGAMQSIIWEQLNGQWCDISENKTTKEPTNSTAPIPSACPQGNVPQFAINASSPEDVLKTVQFADKFSVPLVIKGTGHDFLGRSSAPNRLLLWTHFMKDITYGSSLICGTNIYDTLTVSAGVQWGEAYRALVPFQRVINGGADPDVGASGGQVMGGGHSPLSNTYGLTPDSVLQFEVVTLDGVARVVNNCTNTDLFWALRGGGGGTYAVVTSTTYKTFPDAPTALAVFSYSNTPESYGPALSIWASYSASLAEMGWSGYFYGENGTFTGVFFLPLINDLTMQEATSSFGPVFKSLNNTEGLTENAVGVVLLPSAQTYLSGLDQPGMTGDAPVLGSRLIPKALLQDPANRTKITDIIASIRNDSAPIPIIGIMVAGGATSKATDSAVLPAWRTALWHLVFGSAPPVDGSEEEIEKNFDLITEKLEPLRQATPGSGAYMNEANPRAPQWKEDFFGENYDRLLEIKRKWDPKGLLNCNECVGSD